MPRFPEARAALPNALKPAAQPRLQGEWAAFLNCIAASGRSVKRSGDRTRCVPGFEPAPGVVSLRVLGPVEPEKGRPHDVGSDSQHTNGNSLGLRLDYGAARITLTGDLNRRVHRRLRETYATCREVFACDVRSVAITVAKMSRAGFSLR